MRKDNGTNGTEIKAQKTQMAIIGKRTVVDSEYHVRDHAFKCRRLHDRV